MENWVSPQEGGHGTWGAEASLGGGGIFQNSNSCALTAKTIAASIPFYPFKGIERFYDIQGFLSEPILFKHIVNVLTARYRAKGVTKVCVGGGKGVRCVFGLLRRMVAF